MNVSTPIGIALALSIVLLPVEPAAAVPIRAAPSASAAAPAPSASAAARAPSPAARLEEEPSPEFRAKLQKHVQQNAKGEMAKLVKAEPEQAVAWIVALGEKLAEGPSDEDAALLAALSETWKTVFKSEFGARATAYYTTLDATRKKDRADLRKRYDEAHASFVANLQEKSAMVFANIVDEIEVLASAFEQVGDLYWAAEAWSTYAACYDQDLRGASADLHRAYQGWKHAVEAYEKLDLKSQAQDKAAKRKAFLLSKGYDSRKSEPADAPKPVDAPGAEGAAVKIPMTFELLPTFDAYLRPSYNADEITEAWLQIGLKGKGSTGTLSIVDGLPPLVRVGSSDVRFDLDGDGQGDEKVPLTGHVTPVRVPLGRGEGARPWGMFITTGAQKAPYQGIETNLAGDDNQLGIYVLGAATIVGTLDGTPVRVIDDWMDGRYAGRPQGWLNVGLSRDQVQPELDSVVIGASKRARPWSEIQEVGGKWYKLVVADDGKTLEAKPIAPETGFLKLDYKGPVQPTWLVVRGMPESENSFFDLVEGGSKGVAVPVGSYQLYYGEMRKGKKRQTQKTVIIPPRQTETYEVKKGETTTIELGAPYSIDFRYQYGEEKLTVEGESVVVVGAHGERYERPWNCVPRPEVSWRKKGTKKASKPERMPVVQDPDTINKVGWRATWSPLDLVIEAKGAGEAVEVQLVEKKHEIFGKVESEWKE